MTVGWLTGLVKRSDQRSSASCVGWWVRPRASPAGHLRAQHADLAVVTEVIDLALQPVGLGLVVCINAREQLGLSTCNELRQRTPDTDACVADHTPLDLPADPLAQDVRRRVARPVVPHIHRVCVIRVALLGDRGQGRFQGLLGVADRQQPCDAWGHGRSPYAASRWGVS